MLRITKTFLFLFLASMITVSSVDAQAPCATSDCAQSQGCSGGCASNIGDCGTKGALFGNRQACDGSAACSTGDCGGACGVGGGLMDRIKSYILPGDGNGCAYRSVFGGWSDMQDYNGNNGAGPVTGTFNDGFILGTARGKYLTNNLRMEVENNWRNNSGDDWTSGMGTFVLDGQFNMFSTMVNTVREFGDGRVRPYAGGGIGLGIQDGDFTANGNNYRLDDWAFAYQGILGMNLKHSDRGDLFFEYRYYGNGDTQIENAGVEFDTFSFQSENIVFGFRFKR